MGSKALIFAAGLSLAGCQTTSGDFCDHAKPIRLTPAQVDQLTDAQVNEFLGHNRRLQKMCGIKP